MTLNQALDSWAQEHETVFKRHGLSESKLAVSKGPHIWAPHESSSHHPGIDFFSVPPLIISRNFAYSKVPSVSENPPNCGMFCFSKSPAGCPSDLASMIQYSPPLVSMFPTKEFAPLQDKRIEVGMLKPGDVSYVSVEFESLSASALIFEPILINCFLWDPVKKKRLTETWRFSPFDEAELKRDQHTFALINPEWIKTPRKIAFPTSPNHQDALFVIFLDRLVLKGGGSSMMKYYEKTSNSAKSSAMSDLNDCNQPNSSMTFAWMYVPMKELIPRADPIIKEFGHLVTGQTVSDKFLAEAIAANPNPHDKIAPFSVTLSFSAEQVNVPKLRHYFNFAVCPHLRFVNELVVSLVSAKFHFPRGIRGRNIFAKIQCVSKGKPLTVFDGESMYTTRCQYHVEDPCFHDEIILSLPDDLEPDARLVFDFFHAAVNPRSKNVRKNCGTAILPLFSNGVIISDGPHKIGIWYGQTGQTEVVPPTDSNHVMVDVLVRSSIFSPDPHIQAIFKGEIKNLAPLDGNLLIPHLFGVLDVLMERINAGDADGFLALLSVIKCFSRDRCHLESQYLIFYIKFCAFRKEEQKSFHVNFVKLWRNYIETTPFELKRPDFVCCWFLFELLVKSLMIDPTTADYPSITALCSSLSFLLPRFRESGQQIGSGINEYVAFFCKDLFEFVDHSYVIEMVRQHVAQLDLSESGSWFDRNCFREFFKYFFSTKVFLFFIAPIPNRPSMFAEIMVPPIKRAFFEASHTNDVFQTLYDILTQFGPDEHRVIAPQLIPLLLAIGEGRKILSGYKNRAHTAYLLIVAHYILYYTKPSEVDAQFSRACAGLIMLSRRLSAADKIAIRENSAKSTTDALNEVFRSNQRAALQPQGSRVQRSFGSLRGLSRSMLTKPDVKDATDFEPVFAALTFCIQSLCIDLVSVHRNIFTFNNIIAILCNVDSPFLLKGPFKTSLLSFIKSEPEVVFRNRDSNLKHVIKKLIENLDEENVAIIEEIISLEDASCTSRNRSMALIARGLWKTRITDEMVELAKYSSFSMMTKQLYEINENLSKDELRTGNPDVYSDLLLQKAELLSASPDARVACLLELTAYHESTKYFSEAVISQLTAAAVVAEYLDKLDRIPHFYAPDTPIDRFAVACPPAVSARCPPMVHRDIPGIRGYCTSKYFAEYGLIFLIMTANDTCKRASLFELSTKIHNLLSPIAEHRRLWNIMKRHFTTGSFAWKVISSLSTSTDRSLGDYYRIQFQDQGTYIYRETALANLWQVTERIKHTAEFYSKGKPVEVINEGEKLDPRKFDADKYYVHVKAVQQYFTQSDRRKRVTVFEQNHNVSQFYFDIPLTKSAQGGIENCWLHRTIFTLPYPMPYIVKRVPVPEENITTTVFSPIEYSCESLRKKISSIREACARRDYGNLQMLIQGALLVQVNEGPKKMAEVFLGKGDNENENMQHCAELRATFRKFLKANSLAVKVHSEYAKKNPCFAVLQEELEAGLNRLTSTLQPYLN